MEGGKIIGIVVVAVTGDGEERESGDSKVWQALTGAAKGK